MIKIFTLIVFLFIYSTGAGQHKLHSLAFVNSSYTPVPDVTVQSDDANFSALSNEIGVIDLQQLPDNVNTLFISVFGYAPATLGIDTLSSNNGIATVVLNEKMVTLQDVTITSAGRKSFFGTLSEFDIKLRPFNNSQEILRLMPGLFIGQHAGGGKAEQLFLRGFDLDHGTDINLTVDGMAVNMVSHAHGQGYADLHFVIPEMIEKINFNKGAYYADKGNFTTAGFVHFKTKDYLPNNFLKIEGGQFGTFRTVTGINLLRSGGREKPRSLYLAGEAFFSKGYFDSPQNFNRFNGTIKYHGNLEKNTSITALVTGFNSQWKASGQIPEREVAKGAIGFYGAVDDTEGGQTARYNASIEVVKRQANNSVWRNQVYYSNYRFELYSNFTFFKEDAVNGDQIRQKEKRHIAGYNGSFQHDHYVGQMQLQSTFGAQLRVDDVNDIELSRTKNRRLTTNQIQYGDLNEVNAAAYLSQKLSVTKKLSVTGGLRYDYFNNRYLDKLTNKDNLAYAFILTPKLSFDLALNKNTKLYLYNGRGFHSNDTRAVVQQKGKEILPAAYSTDLGGVFKLGQKLILQTSIWHLWLAQEFVYVGDEGIVEEGGKSRRIGVDASIRYEVATNLFANIDVNYSSPKALEVDKGQHHIPLAPKFTSLGGLVYKRPQGFNGSLFYRIMGDRPATEDNSIVAKGYCIIDAAVNYSAGKCEAGISVQNLLNSKWKETQFATESRLKNELAPVTEIHFTPGSPIFIKAHFIVSF